jgi:serine/threonine-protein kinase
MLGVSRLRGGLGLLLVMLLAVGAAWAIREGAVLAQLERDTVDARFTLRGAQRPPVDVTVVGLDEPSLGRLPRFPFSRRLHARVIENLHAAGARLIVYDIAFDRPTAPEADEALYNAAAQAAPLVLATSLISSNGETEVLGGNWNLQSIGDRAAAAQLSPDADGVVRHTLGQVNRLPTLAVAVLRVLHPGESSQRLARGGWIDFPGPPGTVPALSFADVLQGRFPHDAVRGKVVVVGATAPVLQDVHATAAGSPMAGAELQADAVSTALRGFPLRSPSDLVTLLLIALLAALVPVSATRLGTLGAGIVAIAGLACWCVATQLAFNSGVVLDFGDPAAALVLATVGTLTVAVVRERRERLRLREMFAANASSVVDEVLDPSGPSRLRPTSIIAGYRIESLVGAGGMGVVYRASQLSLDRPVAIKLIRPELARDQVFRTRFKAESRIAASIEHANVIPVYEAGEDDGLLFIAMRFVDGIDLAQLLACGGRLDCETAVRVATQLGGALDAAHAHGLVHRDVKPANALLTFDEPEHVYLTDFGIAKQLGADGEATRAGEGMGTFDYISPEQISGDPLSSRADVYSLSCLLYHCIVGEVPFPRDGGAAKLWAHMNVAPPSVREAVPTLPAQLDDVFARGMAKHATERYETASELAHAFAAALGLRVPAPSRRPLDPATSETGPSAPTAVSQ